MREFQPVRIGDRSAHQIDKKAVTNEDEIVSKFDYPRGHSEKEAPTGAGVYLPMRYVEEKLGKASRSSKIEELIIDKDRIGAEKRVAQNKFLVSVALAGVMSNVVSQDYDTFEIEDSSSQMMVATNEMQELSQQFNMQYLMLQQKTQRENRQYALMSNLFKINK